MGHDRAGMVMESQGLIVSRNASVEYETGPPHTTFAKRLPGWRYNRAL